MGEYNKTVALGLDRVERLKTLADHGITRETIGDHKIKSFMRLQKNIFDQFEKADFDVIANDPHEYSKFLDGYRYQLLQDYQKQHGQSFPGVFEKRLNQIENAASKNAKGFKLLESNESWVHYGTTGNTPKKGNFSYKIYGTFADIDSFNADNITSIMNSLTDAGFKGQLKYAGTMQAESLMTSSDQLVIHGASIKDQKIAYDVLSKNYNDMFQYIGGGADKKGNNHSSFSEILGSNSVNEVQNIMSEAQKEYNSFANSIHQVEQPKELSGMGFYNQKPVYATPDAKLSVQEAYAKYGPDDDMFFISQGQNPEEQRKILEELNSGKKANSVNKDKPKPDSKPKAPSKPESESNTKSEIKTKPDSNVEKPKTKPDSNVNQNKPKPKPASQPKQATNVNNKPVGKPKKPVNTTNVNLPKKNLTGNGKAAIGVALVGLVVGGTILASDKDKKENNNVKQTNEPIDNSYSMQIAQDISSYRYGKKMTGFI